MINCFLIIIDSTWQLLWKANSSWSFFVMYNIYIKPIKHRCLEMWCIEPVLYAFKYTIRTTIHTHILSLLKYSYIVIRKVNKKDAQTTVQYGYQRHQNTSSLKYWFQANHIYLLKKPSVADANYVNTIVALASMRKYFLYPRPLRVEKDSKCQQILCILTSQGVNNYCICWLPYEPW